MKKFEVEVNEYVVGEPWTETEEWFGEEFPDLIEAEDENEALGLAIQYYIDYVLDFDSIDRATIETDEEQYITYKCYGDDKTHKVLFRINHYATSIYND